MDRLVVVDDEPEICWLVAKAGESVGYEAKISPHARDFKRVLSQWQPSVVVLDLSMPEGDGLELLRWLASENSQAQILIMSGADVSVVEAARRVGLERGLAIKGTLQKPFRIRDMKEKLEALKQIRTNAISAEDIERGLAAQEMFLHYQPKVVLKSGVIQGVEALIRWRHPKRGIVQPDEFILLAEKTGAINRLSGFVLTEAIRQQKAWAQEGLDIQVAVNLSAFNLNDERLTDHIVDLCATEKTSPEKLLLEVTETTAMSNALESLDTLARLRLKGFKLSIGDFGTGFSSLTRLQRLPVTEIKIDRSFVMEALSSPNSLIIVKSIISLARNMNLISVAEGIETDQHYKMLAEAGCDLGQGYGIARPMPPDDLLQWGKKWKTAQQTSCA